MYYDINSIRKTTEKGIPDLADKIFAGIVNEEEATNALFKGLRPKLTTELEKRRADEVLWLDASSNNDIKKLRDYVETYDNEAPEYRGRHIDEANQLISLIENDDNEWLDAKSKDAVDAYRHYLDLYDKPAPSYRGKHIDQVNISIKAVKDREDWNRAKEGNSIRSYSDYLSVYDKAAPEYIGQYVKKAKIAIFNLEDDADWQNANNINSVESYESYLNKYDSPSSAYRGKHIESAKLKIEELLPPPPPDPRIADEEAWNVALKLNTIESYKQYLTVYDNPQKSYKGLHISEAEKALYKLQDELDWNAASSEDSIEAYKRYLSIYGGAKGYKGLHIADAQGVIKRLTLPDPRIEDDATWDKAIKSNTIESYEEYLNKYKTVGGLHVHEAENAILRIHSEEDWKNACAANTLSAYKKFVDKYERLSNKYVSVHLPKAKKKIKELTSVPHPIKWRKWLLIVLGLALCWLLWIQWRDNAWPFGSSKSDETEDSNGLDSVKVEEVDSLQWAIDTHNIPMLTKYAELDSTRAYFPLANELYLNGNDDDLEYDTFGKWVVKSFNSADSIRGRKLWDKYAGKIVNDLMSSVKITYEKIDWSNSDDAEQRCLDLFSVYVTNIESSIRLLQPPQKIDPLETKASHYLQSWETVKKESPRLSDEGKSRYVKWRELTDSLKKVTSNTENQIQTNYYYMKYDKE